MKRKSASKSAFFNPRALIGFGLCSVGVALVVFALIPSPKPVARDNRLARDMPTFGEDPENEAIDLGRLEQFWSDRLTYPTGNFNPAWVRQAAAQHERIPRGIPAGNFTKLSAKANVKGRLASVSPLALSTTSFTALGPLPEHMTGCSGCYDYGTTEGRVNDIVIDPTTTTNGSIVAYAASVGGGVWKTTNCCSGSTNWSVVTDDPLIATTSIDTLVIDPHNHNTIYAGTGDLNYGSFSMGSQGILKSTNAGATWTVLGASVFGPDYTEPAGQYPQYNAVGKVRVDPNNSNNVAAGTKEGLYISNDAGVSWTQCATNSFSSQRQDITGLELTNMGGGSTRVLAAVGVRGFATPVQYDLGNQGANGIYSATMPASGCPTFTSITSNANGFVFGTAVSGSPYTTGAAINASSGAPYVSATSGNQLSRIDIAVAPSNPNVIYAQAGSIAGNTASGCGGGSGCQLGAWVTTDGGNSWTFMTGSAGGSLTACTGSAGGGDYPQNWYDQGVAVDPNNADRIYFNTFETWLVSRTGTSWYDTTCGYNGSPVANHVVHVDHHAQAFLPGNSDILLMGDDGGIHGTTNASAAVAGSVRPTWFNMDTGLNAVEFYAGDISGNFANDPAPAAVGGAQDNGPSSATFSGTPTGPVMWQMGLGGDGFSGQINSTGTGPSQAVGAITLSSGGAVAGETFVIGSQTFTFQTAARSGTGQVTLNSSTTTEGNNIVTAINADIPGTATSSRSGGTVTVTATVPGTGGNSIVFTESVTNFAMNGSGVLGGTTQGGLAGSTQSVFWEGNNSGGLSRCVNNCTVSGASWSSKMGGWASDQQSFVLPINLFHGGISGGDDCPNGCGHLIAGTTRVWETITGNGNAFWYITDNPPGAAAGPNLTKGTLGNRSYINQVKYSPKYQSVAIAGTNDGNVQIGFNLGTGAPSQATWVDVTGSNTVLPNRPVLGIALDPSVGSASTPVGYAAVGGFNANTPSTLGHVFQVTCAATCASFNWLDKTGNLPDIPVDSVIVNPNYPQQVFAGTDFGVYFTNDITAASPSWYRFDSGLPHAMIWDMQVDRGATTLSVWTRSRGAYVYPLPSSNIAPAPVIQSAVSRMTHGGSGTFDLNLPLSGATGIEPRSDGTGNYTIVLTFDQAVNSGSASVASGTGNVNNVSFSGNSMIIALTGVTDQQTLAVSTNSVSGTNTLSTSPSVNVGFLNGDVSGDRVVNAGDTIQVRNLSGATVGPTNFQYDVNVDGFINAGDATVVRSKSGDSLP
jgi:hypothetical protein